MLFAAFAMLMGSIAQAQTRGLPDFTDLVDQADPAVVNIRTSAKISARGPAPGGQDPAELFKWFFGPDFEMPGQGNGPGTTPRGPRGGGGGGGEEREVPRGVGSGFFISNDGFILTNHHVVAGADEITVTLTDRREFKAKIIGSDQRTDVALIKIEATGLTPLRIGDPSTLRKGEWVMAIGSPFGLDSTVTAGIVSAKGRDTGDYLPFIQTDVAVNPGNSGGPLLNMRGEVIGINSQIISRNGGFMGISLAIPIDDAMRVVEQLRASGRVVRGRIGVQIGEVTRDIVEALGLKTQQGALVRAIEKGSPAEKAGIQPGDVVLKFGDRTIERLSDLPRAVGDTKPGVSVPVQVWRLGNSRTVNVVVTELQADKDAKVPTPGKAPDEPKNQIDTLGLAVIEVPAARRAELSIQGGVQVQTVEGAAERAGIRPGDIVMALGTTEIVNVNQYRTLTAKLEKGKTYGLLVRRDELTQWVTVKLAK
nr:Do family serine endopeptidase [Pigmentiphaga aceris]